ncbi:RUN and SH3 domain containing protein 1 [Dissostichus eleginoides]|uniref:RUN and SH3 domain containing protein 1 n=1 Tax=Dissostichus eleginoides TaxID=100907 RepID=A0AAD9C4P0_DISEL|nr:RUN and SH3 domain containing protein 1 [Dissostichus eleginoides]
MQSSSGSSQPPKPRRFDISRRTNTVAGLKSHGPGFQREDKNMNTIAAASPRRVTKTPVAATRPGWGCSLEHQSPSPAKIAPAAAPPPLPSVLPLDTNCNEPSLPCLCCDGRSPQDGKGAKEPSQPPSQAQAQLEASARPAATLENKGKNADASADLDNKKNVKFSLSSSTSSSSTSISSCSDLESDCADQSASICSSHDEDNLSLALSPKDHSLPQAPECKPPARSLPSLPLNCNPFILTSHSPIPPCSPDEGYPSALDSPSPDYLGVKGDSEVNKLGLLDFLESVGEFGKMERFSQVIQVARWDLEGEQHWDALRDRLDHLDRLEKVNREVKLAYIAKLHEKGFDLGDLEEQDLSDVMDEMGNIDITWKLYKSGRGAMGDSQEFSDAGVDLTAPSDCEDPLLPDSLTSSPVGPPPRPPKPPARHASVSSDLHTYINISRETTSMAVSTSPTLSTFSPNSSSPTFTTFRCEKPLPPSPPSIPPLPTSKPVPYLTLYTTPSPPPSLPTPTPPIPPPRKRHLARKEAQRLAALQALQENVEIHKLLMLAGVTQAELLKLSPELSVCVGGLEDEGDHDISSRCGDSYEFRLNEREEEKDCYRDRWSSRGKLDGDRIAYIAQETNKGEESTQRTTSFTEMARRRKRSCGLTSDPYYSTGFSNTHETKANNISFDSYRYSAEELDSPPPPPPPRPLPPIPPSVPSHKVSTLVANSAQPDRFDWLIAFTPECEGLPKLPPLAMRKSHVESQKKLSSSGSSPGSAPHVTTFKELRNGNKSSFLQTKVITDPDPDPNVITPDADILYNLRWRRQMAGGDGNEWEYTSQAQAFFMQPPPALTSMAALKEMLQRADEEGRQPELCPIQKIGCSVSDSSLWTTGRESLFQSSQPYFLHTALPSYHPGYCNAQPFGDPRPHSHAGRESKDKYCNTPNPPAASSACIHRDDSGTDMSFGFNFESLDDKSAHTLTQTTETRPGRPKSFLLSLHITCTTLKTALCTGEPLLVSPLSVPSPLPIAPEPPPQALQASASAPRFSPALTPCLPSLLPSTIQTFTLLYRQGRPPLPPKLYQAPPQTHVATVRSVSFAGSVQRTEASWMGEDVKHPMRGLGLSSLCLQEKKALVSAVSVAVEAILAQFSSSRTVVQKSLSVNKCLCPALHSLLTDGLKPHQSDLIAGRRPNSAWGLVQASTKPGPKTQALFNLQVRIGELPQLRQSKHRFNAFLLGLLNTKLLDFWLSHLQSCSDVLETYYRPTSIMRLSLTACQPLFEELLLVLQPLSLLTFNLDLLFQHHHLEADSHSPDIPSPPCQDAGIKLSKEGSQSKTAGCRYMESLSDVDFRSSEQRAAKQKSSPLSSPMNGGPGESTQCSAAPTNASATYPQTSPQLLWVQEKNIGDLPPPNSEEDSLTQQAGQVIQQGWGAVMRWGGRMSHNLSELNLKKEEMRMDLPELHAESDFAPVSSGAPVPWRLGGSLEPLKASAAHQVKPHQPG